MDRRAIASSFPAFVALILLLAFGVHAGPPADKDLDGPGHVSEAAAKAMLERRLPELNFNGNKLSDIVDFMRDVTGANIFVNWKALQAAKITKDTPVTLRIRDVQVSKALDLILTDAAGENNKLAWIRDEDVIIISTVADLKKEKETKTYDLRFLLDDAKGDARQKRLDAAVKMITGSIDPKSWHAHDGSIKEESGQLVVTQSKENQNAIANLLEQLKALHEAK